MPFMQFAFNRFKSAVHALFLIKNKYVLRYRAGNLSPILQAVYLFILSMRSLRQCTV